MKKVAIQGVSGAFHEIAARNYFKEEIDIIPCHTFKDLFETIRKDSSVIGVMAIENTIAGSLLPNHKLLSESKLTVVGEYKLRISHCLCALPKQSISDITEVHSHPIALMQCEDFLDKHTHLKPVESLDTALSAKEIAEGNIKGRAAICSTLAAEMYGLEILENEIETNKRNFTRFLVITDKWAADDLLAGATINKSTLTFTLPHQKGSLAQVLSVLSFYRLNLTKIQSLPIVGREWEYQFYITVNFDNYTRFKQGIAAVEPLLKDFIVLGEYESADTIQNNNNNKQ